jgi:hypothetical protein
MTIIDATPSGDKLRSFTLASISEQMTAREIIRARIYQEVQDHQRAPGDVFKGFVQPIDAERVLNGFRLRKQRTLDWEEQFRRYCEAFESYGFFLLVGDRQAESLEESFEVNVDTEVQFVKLTPLVGG